MRERITNLLQESFILQDDRNKRKKEKEEEENTSTHHRHHHHPQSTKWAREVKKNNCHYLLTKVSSQSGTATISIIILIIGLRSSP
jgi:hypothetical protein